MTGPATTPELRATSTLTPPARAFSLPFFTRATIFLRLLMIQASWNYEILLGNGIAFCTEPALRLLPGGKDGEAYRAALARHSQYFNSHPYLAGLAVGALVRAELDQEAPARIERFRTALCGPLGSVGDRLVWAAWLPFCSLVALLAFGLGAAGGAVVIGFLLLYNTGHLALRGWALNAGLTRGMKVAQALGNPVLRQGPQWLDQATAFIGGAGMPLALARVIGPGRTLLGVVVIAVMVGAVVLNRLHGRLEGWRLALVALVVSVLYSIAR